MTRNALSSAPAALDELTFQDMVADQLRRSPWVVLSAALHALAIILLWALVPGKVKATPKNHAEVVQQSQPEIEDPIEPPKDPEIVPEDPIEDFVLEPVDFTMDDPVEVADFLNSEPSTLSAFTSDSTNTAVGISGNAGGPYGGRGKGNGRGGIPRHLNPVIDRALKWLADHQDEDGKWDCDEFMKHDVLGQICDGAGNAVHDVGVTGLALLAFLGDNNTMRAGPYRDVVKRGVLWLREQQQDNGLFGTETSHDFIYDHAIAAYAMCEAFGLSRYRLLKDPAQRAISYLESHRNPYSVWRYQPRDNDNDTSVTGWCIMAYESGKFFGLQISDTALQLAAAWLDEVTEPNGRHGYRRLGELSSRKHGDHKQRFPVERGEAMTAVGLFSRYFLGQDPKEKPVMHKAADLIASKPPVWNEKNGSIDHYYWYYATYALFQAGGRPWQQWQRALDKAVVKTQHQDKSQSHLCGSWDPVGAWGEDGGRVYSTAILTLTMQAHYRYSPLLR
ncbi:MAG: hypothetical protein NXI31_06155 [bacterium]|nr:hypothetical protein [bacterium]